MTDMTDMTDADAEVAPLFRVALNIDVTGSMASGAFPYVLS